MIDPKVASPKELLELVLTKQLSISDFFNVFDQREDKNVIMSEVLSSLVERNSDLEIKVEDLEKLRDELAGKLADKKAPKGKKEKAKEPEGSEVFTHTNLEAPYEVLKKGLDGRQRVVKVIEKDNAYYVMVDHMLKMIKEDEVDQAFEDLISNSGQV